ncbi:MAG: ABC transporter permease [Nitrospirae bacterium]|nr:ABC transporter permease [Nitrospirota bacterium]
MLQLKNRDSLASRFLARFMHNPLAIAGSAVILSLFVVAALASVISPYDPNLIDTGNILAGPTAKHLFGTDELGRDVFTRMLYSTRISLLVGFVAVGISVGIGVVIGAVAGFYGGWIDSLLMRFVDIMLCFPTIFLILAVIAILEPSIWNIMIIIGITSWMGVCRLVRAEFLTLKERDFVMASRAVGASDLRIIFRHVLPNAMSPVLVSAVLGVGGAILIESSLSFLGLGVQPPAASWGNMLASGKDNIEIAWWLSLFPGLAILVTVLGYNLLGEGLQDALNPRTKD